MPLQTFNTIDQERQQAAKHLQTKDNDSVSCPTCDGQWFEEVKVTKYKADHHVIVGQSVPPSNPVEFVLLKCVRCQDLLEPRILHNTRDIAGGSYDNLLDTLEGKGDKRKGQAQGPSRPVAQRRDEITATRL